MMYLNKKDLKWKISDVAQLFGKRVVAYMSWKS